MTRTQLLGRLDPDTRQWHDGVLTTTAIAINAEKSGAFSVRGSYQRFDNSTFFSLNFLASIAHMLICDGDVDPEWIEALNSVLDDNK